MTESSENSIDPSAENKTAEGDGPHVALFVSCLVDLYRPNVGFASIHLLEQAGCRVTVPDAQTCCGQPAFNSGEMRNSAEIARNTIEAFSGFDYVVVPSGSCAGMLRHHYIELFEEDKQWLEKAHDLAERVYELTSFLTDVARLPALEVSFDSTVTYHDSCSSLREMEVQQQPRQLLKQVAGLDLKEMDETEVCCGFGGTFCVKYPEISERMVTDKVALAKQSGAEVLLAGDMGCLLNITGRMRRLEVPMRSYHVAEVLAGMADGPGIGEATGNLKSDQTTGQTLTVNKEGAE